MIRFSFLIIAFFLVSANLYGQRTSVFAAFQLIENEKYTEAKEAVEEALKDKSTKDWARTWYARGLLCQKAYEKGIKDNDKKIYELYPDQLFVAYESFEKSLTIKRTSKIVGQLEPIYVLLANDFMALGKKEYEGKKYEKSLKAYENALKINESYILTVNLDTNLLYNTALAAYNSKQNEKSIQHLNRLNEMNYSQNIPLLLSSVHLTAGDTSNAEMVLKDGIAQYDKSENLVLVYVDLLYKSEKSETAIEVLDSASVRSPEKHIYPYTKGLIYQKTEQYDKAVEAYKHSIELDPEKLNSYINIGTCYFNIGVEKEQNAKSINNNSQYREELAKSVLARENAVMWLEKVLEKDPKNQSAREQLIQLYRSLHLNEKLKALTP
jgi:tetratricopeptide (TPR) repeat protein